MKDTAVTILFLILLFVVLPVLILWARDRVRDLRGRRSPEQKQADADAYRERLLNPKSGEVEASIGGLLPQRLLDLYMDHDTILRKGMEIRSTRKPAEGFGEWVEEFLPLDVEGQRHTWDLVEAGWGKGFNFAADGCGNFYWVPLSEIREADAPVYFACHDPWGNEKVAESLAEFLSWPRVHRGRK
jgi:hypothetical protein